MRPDWLKVRYQDTSATSEILAGYRISTVCEGANCPNIGECFAKGRATFLLMGRGCTRNCGFCLLGGHPVEALDPNEPIRVASAIQKLGLTEVVLTSVTRDDLSDGGATYLAYAVEQVYQRNPHCRIELLVPDFQGQIESIETVCRSPISIFSHNLETVSRLTPLVRNQADYRRSLSVLSEAHRLGIPTKSGLMLGLGESIEEVLETLNDLHDAGVQRITLGQYLSWGESAYPVNRYLRPEEFESLRLSALQLGFEHVEAGPLVRSSYDRG